MMGTHQARELAGTVIAAALADAINHIAVTEPKSVARREVAVTTLHMVITLLDQCGLDEDGVTEILGDTLAQHYEAAPRA